MTSRLSLTALDARVSAQLYPRPYRKPINARTDPPPFAVIDDRDCQREMDEWVRMASPHECQAMQRALDMRRARKAGKS